MKKNKTEATIIISAVHEWIVTYLPLQRSSSIHTQKAYTDALALYVNFLESEKGISCETMSSDCFSIAFIHEWMFWLKTKRKSCNSTCNHRLACLRSFLKYLSHKDIRIIDISEISVIADYFIIASGSNANQLQAMQDSVDEQLYKAGYHAKQIEGNQRSSWILMDYSDIIVHIFSKEDRLFYDLERIWRDGKDIDPEEL